MNKNFIRYIFTSIISGSILLLIFVYYFLPLYVGSGNDFYLPDIRSEYLQNGKYQLVKLGFDVKIVEGSFSENYKPGTIISMSPRAFTKVKAGRTITLTVAGHRNEFLMPGLAGMTLRNAKILLRKKELYLDTIIYEYNNKYSKNLISFHLPKKDRIISTGTFVTLGISKGGAPEYFYVPDIVGISLSRGRKTIIDSGLRVGKIEYEYQPKLLKNTIIDQSMSPGMKVSYPALIDIIVSKEKE